MSRVNPWKITGYKAGQNVICKVSHAEPGGYAVIIPKDNLPGFLPTEQPLKAGEEVLAQYVCVSNSRILLQCRFGTNTKPGASRHETVRWEEQLDQIGGKSGEKIDYHRPSEQSTDFAAQAPADNGYDNYQEANYAQEFDGDNSAPQGNYEQQGYQQDQYQQYPQEQYAENYSDAQGQYQQQGQSQTQPEYAQNYSQTDSYGQNQPVNYQAPPDYSQSQYQAPAQQGQGFDFQSQEQQNYAQQNQFSPQGGFGQSDTPSSFATQQTGGMQFKPSLPVDFAETQDQWTGPSSTNMSPPNANQHSASAQMQNANSGNSNSNSNSNANANANGNANGNANVNLSANSNQNQYQVPMQAAAQYQSGQQTPPVSYQGPSADNAYQPAQPPVTGGFQQGAPVQFQQNAAPAQYDSGSQAVAPVQATAYQSTASYQGPSQAQALPAYAPVIVPSAVPAPAVPEITPSDDWGYAGQGWDESSRLTSESAVAPAAVPVASEADEAFRVWAPTKQTREFNLKRATDLVPPAFDLSSLATFTAEEQDIEWLITDIEGGMRTGCVKAVSQSTMSRSAALLYKGRAVGCIYGRKQQPENYGTEQSLQIMLQDLEKADTAVQLYDLPDSVVLPMSALFLGYPVPREENVDARTYMDYMCNWFETKAQTACLAINFPSRSATTLCFIHEGKFCGAFYVEEQKFSDDKEFVYSMMQTDPQASVEANILPPEMTSSAVRFGFNLSMARKKGY